MSLPPNFEDSIVYFRECLTFLNKYKWIFCSSNTKYLKDYTFDSYPNEWENYFQTVETVELNCFPDGYNDKSKLPSSLREFQEKLLKLTPTHSTISSNLERKLMKGMSPKKSHEILELSKFIIASTDNAANVLIDFGSGLGYLSEALYKSKNIRILGLECDPQRTEMARKRQEDYYPESLSNVVYETMKIAAQSGKPIELLIAKHFPDLSESRHAIIGLHACGDLSITAMDLFLKIKSVSSLIIMPCCYHKLEFSENSTDDGIFKNFPLSQSLLQTVKDSQSGFEILNRPFLRLACQQTVSRWRNMSEEDHQKHGMEMFTRAVAECLVQERKIISKRKGRYRTQFETIYERIVRQYYIQTEEGDTVFDWTTEHKEKVDEIQKKYPNGPQSSEGLTCLQTALQSLCENIVLYDRVCYIQEKASALGINITVNVTKILKDDLSPRCFVFHAEKRA